MTSHTAEIEKLKAILAAGARRVTIDGQTVEYDFDAIRQRLRELEAEDDCTMPKRPRASTINLSGF